MSKLLKVSLDEEDGMGTYERLGRILYSKAEMRKQPVGRCEDWKDPL
jgi:hypothetical protein